MVITRVQKQHIEELAEGVLKKHSKTASVPLDVVEVAKTLGLRVEFFPFPNEVSGLLKKEERVIGINENHPEKRRRFTLAHEIGHYVLGHEIININDLVDDTNTDTASPIEREANYFASALLMPEKVMREYVKKKKLDVRDLADAFGVSEQAMTIRVLELELI